MFRVCISAILTLALVSCSTVKPVKKFEMGQPVAIHRGFSDLPIWQNGSPVYEGGLVNAVFDNKTAVSHIENASALRAGAYVMAFVGGGAIGATIAGRDRAPALWVGLGSLISAFTLGYFANEQLAKAAEVYNQTLPHAYLSPVHDGAVAGVQLSY